MPYYLVQPETSTVDLGRDGGKWRHGWIPLNGAAFAIAAKKGIKHGGSAPSAPRPSTGGKSRLSTSTTRPSRLKLKGDKGRTTTTSKVPLTREEMIRRLTPSNPSLGKGAAQGDLFDTGASADSKSRFPDTEQSMIARGLKIGDVATHKRPDGSSTPGEHKIVGYARNGNVVISDMKYNTQIHAAPNELTRVAKGGSAGGMTHSGEAAFKHVGTVASGRHEGMSVFKQPNADKPREGFKIPPRPGSDEHAQVKRAFPDRTTPDGFTIQHRAEVGDNHRPTGAFSVSVADAGSTHTAGKRYTKIGDGTNAEIDALGRARDKRRGGKELDSRYTMQTAKPESAAPSGWKESSNPETQRNNAYNRSSVNDSDRAAGEHYVKSGTTHVQSQSGSVHEIDHVKNGLVHTKDGRVIRAGRTTSQPRGATERIQQAAPAAYSLKVNGLEGYGVTDLKRIAKLSAGPHDASHAPAGTIAAAELELRNRGYVKTPSGAWAKPKAPQTKGTTHRLVSQREADAAKAAEKRTPFGAASDIHRVGQQSPSADRIGAEAARHSANARANEAARQSPARDALMAKRSAIRAEMARPSISPARKRALAAQLTTVNRKLAP